MKFNAHILVLLMICMLTPTSTALACGNASDKKGSEVTTCKMDATSKTDDSKEKTCCHKGNKCDGSCDNPSCHCPVSVNTPMVLDGIETWHTVNFSQLNNLWAFVQNHPKAVYFSIWQPPKIG